MTNQIADAIKAGAQSWFHTYPYTMQWQPEPFGRGRSPLIKLCLIHYSTEHAWCQSTPSSLTLFQHLSAVTFTCPPCTLLAGLPTVTAHLCPSFPPHTCHACAACGCRLTLLSSPLLAHLTIYTLPAASPSSLMGRFGHQCPLSHVAAPCRSGSQLFPCGTLAPGHTQASSEGWGCHHPSCTLMHHQPAASICIAGLVCRPPTLLTSVPMPTCLHPTPSGP